MKRILLSLALSAGCVLTSQAQVVVAVQEPANIVGSYEHTYATIASGWGVSDLTIPANAVVDTLAMVDDGTAADSLGCGPLVNGADVAGKIAFIYRGTCEFGEKAISAENAGAVAVIIVSNVSDPVAGFNMLPASQGANVTIPVVMITQADGALIRAEMDAGNDVVAFIGNKTGFFADDIGMTAGDILMSEYTAKPALIAQDDTEFDVMPGAWVRNFGNGDQVGITLNVTVEQNGSTLYDETSAGVDILSGDSAFLTVPTFSQSSYSGFYTMTYTAAIGGGGITDEFDGDNTFVTRFFIDSLWSYADIDPVTELPVPPAHYRPTGNTTGFTACTHFQDPNASRLGALGIYTSTTKSGTDSVTGEFIEANLYEWNDVFTGLSDPNIQVLDINTIATGEYNYLSDQNGEVIYIPFDVPVSLVDDQRYLFCVTTFTDQLFVGYDDYYDYDENTTMYDQPVSVLEDGGSWFVLGFGTDLTCAVTPLLGANDVSVNDRDRVDLTPYPNPTAQEVRIPLQGLNGNAELTVRDMTGKVVLDQEVTLGGEVLVVPADRFRNGTHLFDLRLRDGRRSTFRVVVTR